MRKSARFTQFFGTMAVCAFVLGAGAANAACTGPAGNAGDIVYGTNNVMAYCNGTSWISMGQSSSVAFGTLTTGAFCTATSSTQISCTTTTIDLATKVSGVLPPANGGTGVANSSTITLGGNLTTSGAYTLTLTTTGNTNVTLPTSGTLIAGPASAAQGDILYYNGSSWTNLGAGTSGYVLQTQGTGANPTWAAPSIGTGAITGTVGTGQGGTGTSTTFTQGSVVFAGASGIYTQDNANFFYDATNHRLGIGTASPTANLTVNGTTVFTFGSDYTTIGSQSAVALGSTSAVRYAGTAAATFYGIAAGVNGQIIHLTNASSYTLTLSNQSTLEGTATNKIITGTAADLQMAAGSSVILQYDGTTARWRVVGGSGGGTPAGTTGQVQYNTAGAFDADSNLYWDKTNKYLGIGTDTPTYNIDAATGIIAAPIMHVKPQSVTPTTTSSTGGIAIGTALANQMAYYSGTSTLAATSKAYVGTNGIGIGTATAPAALTVYGTTALQYGADYTTVGSQADVNLGASSSVRYAGSAIATFYGIVAGTSGQIIILSNASSYNLTLSNQSGSESTAANRIITGSGGDMTMLPGTSAILQYDGTAARWRVASGGGGGSLGTSTTMASPSITGDMTSGLYTPAGSTVAVVTAGTERMRVDSTGNVAVGTATANSKLQIYGGEVQPGTSGNSCASTNAGALRWTGSYMQYCNGSAWSSLGGTCATADTQTFLTSGTWTKPSCGTITRLQCWGGGGGGSNNSSYRSGGGGGAYNEIIRPTAILGATETVTIGAGGATGNPASTGGTSSFGTWLYAYGGAGGYTMGGGGGGITSAGGSNTGTGGSPGGGITSATVTVGTYSCNCNNSSCSTCSYTYTPPPTGSVYGGGGGSNSASTPNTGGPSGWGGGGGAYYSGTGGSSGWGGGGGGGTAGASGYGGAGGTSSVAGSVPGGGGGYAAAGGAGKCVVTTW